jgi:pimeloyl-ACP methyl ester carboxylesterase
VAVPVIMAQLRACAAHDTYARLPRLQMPTLVVHGTVDRILPFSNGELIASRIAGSRLEPLERIGHLFFWEQPENSAELLCAHALQPA